MNTKHLLYAGAIYLVVVGIASYMSESSSDSPTADKIASLPSFGSSMLNVGAGVALFVFAPKIAAKV